MGFPCGSAGKESAHNAGDLAVIPQLGRSPGARKGYPLQYSGLGNSMDCTVLIEFCQENALIIANTLFQQHKRRLYPWTSPDGQHWNQIDYILCSQRWSSYIQSAKTRPGADCGSDHELLIAKFRLKLKKVGKTTRPFRYDLNQIKYTVEVRNRLQGQDLIDIVPHELWMEVHDIVQESGIKTTPKKKTWEKAKWPSEETLQIAVKRSKKQRRKGKIYTFECRVPKNSKER